MDLKQNINKIHFDISNQFKISKIEEKSNIKYGNYIEISVKENKKNIVAIIKKEDLNNNKFNWSYKSNPNLEESNMVQRSSTVKRFTEDLSDIFEKSRFDKDYIKNINS